MNSTLIEWVKNPDGTQGFTWNVITGCLNHVNGLCKGGGFPCYAYRLANGRLRDRYLANKNTAPLVQNVLLPNLGFVEMNPFYPRYWRDRLNDFMSSHSPYYSNRDHTIKAKGVFVCDMGELFGDWIPQEWQEKIFRVMRGHPEHRFYLLTKQPQNLSKWSPFPDNCWVGITLTKPDPDALLALDEVEAKVRFMSVEPMLARFPEWDFSEMPVDWLIIGGCTGTQNDLSGLRKKYPHLHLIPYGKKWVLAPPIEHVEEIVRAADKAGVKVFLKDNLKPLFTAWAYPEWARCNQSDKAHPLQLRQELPEKGEL